MAFSQRLGKSVKGSWRRDRSVRLGPASAPRASGSGKQTGEMEACEVVASDEGHGECACGFAHGAVEPSEGAGTGALEDGEGVAGDVEAVPGSHFVVVGVECDRAWDGEDRTARESADAEAPFGVVAIDEEVAHEADLLDDGASDEEAARGDVLDLNGVLVARGFVLAEFAGATIEPSAEFEGSACGGVGERGAGECGIGSIAEGADEGMESGWREPDVGIEEPEALVGICVVAIRQEVREASVESAASTSVLRGADEFGLEVAWERFGVYVGIGGVIDDEDVEVVVAFEGEEVVQE